MEHQREGRDIRGCLDLLDNEVYHIKKYLFGNGIKGLFGRLEDVEKGVNKLLARSDASSDITQNQNSLRLYRAKVIGIWFTGISIVVHMIVTILGLI